MYNLLMVGIEGYWEAMAGDCTHERFLEYTAQPIRERFQGLNEQQIAAIRAMPAVFAYETATKAAARVGQITEVRHRTGGLSFSFQFDPAIPPIAPEVMEQLASQLDIEKWEKNRTHWAIKDVDLFKVLSAAGVPGCGAALTQREQMNRLILNVPFYDPANRQAVFVVHGRDNSAKNEVARYLDAIGLKALVLHEQPNAGRTLITKFQEVAATASFAVVLITPDDIGGLSRDFLSPRARQNVIFELGFFIGRLGPKHVCALVAGNVEKPSDFDGVVYVPYSPNGGWKLELARELAAAGIGFDANMLFHV